MLGYYSNGSEGGLIELWFFVISFNLIRMVLIQDCERTAKKTENRLILVKLLLNIELKIRTQIFEYPTHHCVLEAVVLLKWERNCLNVYISESGVQRSNS